MSKSMYDDDGSFLGILLRRLRASGVEVRAPAFASSLNNILEPAVELDALECAAALAALLLLLGHLGGVVLDLAGLGEGAMHLAHFNKL
jgi:hypothetical protein